MVFRRLVKLTKESNGTFKFGLPKAWKDIYENEDKVVIKIDGFRFPIFLHTKTRLTIPKALIEYLGIDSTIPIQLFVDSETKELTINMYETLGGE